MSTGSDQPSDTRPGRVYHPMASLTAASTTRRTHICVIGPVTYVRKQQDGDWHITLDDGKTKLVLEIIPLIPLPVPRKGQRVQACGISRRDVGHGWAEIHPLESIKVVPK